MSADRLQRTESRKRIPEVLDRLRAEGYVVLPNLVSAADIDQISLELESWFASTPRSEGDFYGWNTTRFGCILLKSPTAAALLLHPLILALMDEVLAPHCDWYQLNLSQAIRIHPGERRQVPHRDDEMWPVQKSGFEFLVNVMWALSDFTNDNGATMLWPRSQFRAALRDPDEGDAILATMPRGSALVYLGSVTHFGGANRSDAPRTGLVFSYCLGWLKQYENAFLSHPPEIAAKLPARVRDLLGYRIHRPNLGVFEGQDPAVLFEGRSHHLPTVDAIPEAVSLELHDFYRKHPS